MIVVLSSHVDFKYLYIDSILCVFYEFLYFENCMSFKNVYAYQNQLVLQCTLIF